MAGQSPQFQSLGAEGSGPRLMHHVGRAREFVFVGGMTPHDPLTGAVTGDMRAVPADEAGRLQSGIYFVDSQLARIKSQTWQTLRNLKDALDRMSASFDQLVHLRVFLRDIRDEPAVLDVLRKVVGELPSGEIVQAWNPGAPESFDIQIDAIALCGTAARRNVSIPAIDHLSAPFALATRGGDLLFSSCIAGIHTQDDGLATRLTQIPAALRGIADKAVGPVTPRVEGYLAQQLKIWEHFHAILRHEKIPQTDLLLNFMWVRRSMREMADGYTNRPLLQATGSKHCLTTFPAAGLRFPDALVEGRIVAVYPDAKRPKTIKVADHGMSGAYVGAVQGGGLIFTSGEVPVQTEAGLPIRTAADLTDDMRTLDFGRYHVEALIMPQADFVLKKLKATLAHYGVSFQDVVHQSLYLTNPEDFPALERIASLYFGATLPPTTIVPIHRPSNAPSARLEYEVTLASPD